jgi:hypothetical protein
MSLFLFPKSFCLDLDSILRKFWWDFPQEKKKNLTLLPWKSICTPKYVGGLGIRTMELQNRALLSKLGWQIHSNQDLLWVRALKAKYLSINNFMDAPIKNNASYLWKGTIKKRLVIEKCACWAVSKGIGLNIWSSPWIPSISFPISSLPNLSVSNLIDGNTNSWNASLIHTIFYAHSASQILNIHIPLNPRNDMLVWSPSPSAKFSVKSTHELLIQSQTYRDPPLEPLDWNHLWSLKLQHRHKLLLWKIKTIKFLFYVGLDQINHFSM